MIEQRADVAAVNNDGELPIDIAETEAMEDLLDRETRDRGQFLRFFAFFLVFIMRACISASLISSYSCYCIIVTVKNCRCISMNASRYSDHYMFT